MPITNTTQPNRGLPPALEANRRSSVAVTVGTPTPPDGGEVELFGPQQVGPASSCPASTTNSGRLAPAAVPGYRIERELGRGGMGTVYLARQLSLDRAGRAEGDEQRVGDRPGVRRPVHPRGVTPPAQLSHPNIVQIHDIGEADGARFFSMEYVPGRSLADVLAKPTASSTPRRPSGTSCKPPAG